MFTDLELDTRVVSIGKVATPVPAGTATVAGTAATDGLLLDRETTAPPTGAGPLNITDPLVVSPPTIVEGLMETDDSDGGFTVRVEDFETPPYRPEMVTAVETDTGKVVIAKVALMAPVATVTDDGTVATEGLPLDSDTTAPPARAGASSVTVPIEPFPPITEEGEMDSEASVTGISGRTVRVEDFETPPYRPEMVTAVETDTGKVVIAKVALLAPAATVTDDGTVAAEGVPLDSDTTAPPARAGASSVTVPVDPFPPTTVEGLRESESRTRGITDRLVDMVTPPYKEEMLTAVETDTGKVGIAKGELLAPTATVTAEGTI